MDVFASALAANPMQTRQDAVTALLDLIRPLKAFYSAGGALLKIGSTAAHYGEKDARMEGWARILWGLGPLFGGDNTALPVEQQAEITEWVDLYRTGLIHGTDPSHPEYWGTSSTMTRRWSRLPRWIWRSALPRICFGHR